MLINLHAVLQISLDESDGMFDTNHQNHCTNNAQNHEEQLQHVSMFHFLSHGRIPYNSQVVWEYHYDKWVNSQIVQIITDNLQKWNYLPQHGRCWLLARKHLLHCVHNFIWNTADSHWLFDSRHWLKVK